MQHFQNVLECVHSKISLTCCTVTGAVYQKVLTNKRLSIVHTGKQSQSYCVSPAIWDHLTQVTAPRLNPSQLGWYSIYLPQKDGRQS